LRRRVRKDAGQSRSVSHELSTAIRKQYAAHPTWSYLLHYENLKTLVEKSDVSGSLQVFTLKESPHQNGKQETFFAPVEGKLMAMLEGVRHLDLDLLNRSTCAWVELDYHRTLHEGIDTTPLDRARTAHSRARDCPSVTHLRDAFRQELTRKQRRGDGTISVLGVRFEVPARFRHIEHVHVRVARWDLRRITMVDPRHGTSLAVLHPLDKQRNADGRRKPVDPTAVIDEPPRESGIAPRLQHLLEKAEQSGMPASFIPSTTSTETHDD